MQDSLIDRLQNEKQRNHLDVRHRLDQKGNRYGKVISFETSELRIIELLEGICKTVKTKYELALGPDDVELYKEEEKADGGGNGKAQQTQEKAEAEPKQLHWAKTTIISGTSKSRNVSKHQKEIESRLLENFCSSFIEKFEDDIVSKIIRGGKTNVGSFNDLLCGAAIGGYCDATAGRDPWLLEAEMKEALGVDDQQEVVAVDEL